MPKSKGLFKNLVDRIRSRSETESEEFREREISHDQEEFYLDETFVQRFTKGGGHFVYCTDELEAITMVNDYIEQHMLTGVFISDSKRASWANVIKTECTFQNDGTSNIVLSGCEALVADTGGIMVHSEHIGPRRLAQLPATHIILANTSQLVHTLQDSMVLINQRYRTNRPSNIAMVKSPNSEQIQMASADPNKDRVVFLVLIEDQA